MRMFGLPVFAVSSRAMAWMALALSAGLSVGCSEPDRDPTSELPVPGDAAAAAAAPTAPVGPLFVGPTVVAHLGSPDAGPATTRDGPVLEAGGGTVPDTWTLPETPKLIRVTLPHATELAVRIDDADRLPWPSRAERPQAAAGAPLVSEVAPIDPLLAGTVYVVVVQAVLAPPGGVREWTIPLSVETGASAPTAWQEQPKPTRGKRRRR